MTQQTAVEWLVKRWKKLQAKGEKMTWQQVIDITELVKEMEKEQILKSHIDGQPLYSCQSEKAEQYYNKTYEK